MKAFVTGGTGFLGGRLVAKLRERGDEVVALVRSPVKAERLSALGCELVTGDLGSRGSLARAMAGCEVLFHVAAIYRIGIPESERAAMFDANVTGTSNVLDAGTDTGVRRIVYVSTNSVLGNTRGAVVDETHERVRAEGFLSAYDETKLLAHDAALERISHGAPIVIVQPGGIYGPGDHTAMGAMFERAFRGEPTVLPFGGVGLNWVHVDDVAAGILLAHDRGAIGQTYILGGEIAMLRRAVEQAYAAGGHKARILPLSIVLVRAVAPLGPLLGRNVREYLSASNGVTYWGTDAKARRELGYAPRDLAAGLHDAFAS